MVTGQTLLYCTLPNDTSLKKGGIYTLNAVGQKCGLIFISVMEHEKKWFSMDRFEVIDHVDISQLTQILEN